MLLTVNDISDTLSTCATTPAIYGKFDTSLLEINLKFLLQSLRSIQDVLINCFYNFWGNFNYCKGAFVANKRMLKYSNAQSNLICPVNN